MYMVGTFCPTCNTTGYPCLPINPLERVKILDSALILNYFFKLIKILLRIN